MIFSNLNIIELLNVSSTNEYFRQLSSVVFRRRIDVKTFIFSRSNYIPVENYGIASKNEIEKTFYIENYDVMLAILKRFGHLLINLRLDYRSAFDVERRQQIAQYTSKYCGETLLELDIRSYDGFELEYFSMPFKKVEILTVNRVDLRSDKTTLDQKFPVIRQLNMKYAYVGGWNGKTVCISEFSHLERLSIESNLNLGNSVDNYYRIEAIILNSPKLKSLRISNCPYELLSFINENASQLIELELIGTTFKNSRFLYDVDFHFKNVKKLYLKTNCDPPQHFRFDQLEDLRIDGSFHFGVEWLNFTIENTNLIRFEFVDGYLDDHKLRIIGNNLKNIEIASIRCDSTVRIATINQFVNNNDKLNRLIIFVNKSISVWLQASLRTEWNLIDVVDYQWNTELHFEKK